MRDRIRVFALERGGLLSLAIVVVYLWLAPTFIADGDNAEFSTLSATGGVAHPPGYPLYVLYLRALSWLPSAPGAHTASLATALLGGAAVLVLHAACRAWGARPLAASLAVAIMAGGPVVLRLHTAAEVFALNDLIVALVLWLSAANGPLRGTRRTIALALVAGLGLSNQHTCALLAPVGILGAVRGVREASGPALRTIVLGLAALAAGLLPYLYLFVAPDTPISWGHPDSLAALLAHFTRADYGGIGAFSAAGGETDVGANLGAFVTTLLRGWLWLPGGIALAALAYRVIVKTDGEPRIGWALLAVSFLIAGPLLAARFNVRPVGVWLYIVHRFHLLGIVLLTVPAAAGFDAALKSLARRRGRELQLRAGVREALAIGVFAAAAGASLPYILATHSPAVEKGIVNMLESLPPGAVVIGTADDVHFGSIYVQQVHRVRPDVVVIAWPMMNLPWYRSEIAARGVPNDPYRPSPEGDTVPSVRVARQVLATGRPLFVEISMGHVLQTFDSYPYGLLLRVLPRGTAKPNLDEIIAINHDLFAKFDLGYPRPDDRAAYAVEMQIRYMRTWDILSRALAEAGRKQDAAAAREIMRDLAPTQ